jgi:hypothetical protein
LQFSRFTNPSLGLERRTLDCDGRLGWLPLLIGGQVTLAR